MLPIHERQTYGSNFGSSHRSKAVELGRLHSRSRKHHQMQNSRFNLLPAAVSRRIKLSRMLHDQNTLPPQVLALRSKTQLEWRGRLAQTTSSEVCQKATY